MADREIGGDVEVSSTVQWKSDDGRFAKVIGAAATASVKEAIGEGVRIAVELAPKRKGDLARSIAPFMNGPSQGGWIAGSGHAMPQEHGARAHKIGYEGQILANKEQGFYAKGPVKHPGNPATHFMRDSYRLVSRTLLSKMKRKLPG